MIGPGDWHQLVQEAVLSIWDLQRRLLWVTKVRITKKKRNLRKRRKARNKERERGIFSAFGLEGCPFLVRDGWIWISAPLTVKGFLI